MSSCMNVCMLVCMFILGVSLILEDKLGERKEPLQLRMVKLLGPEVIGSLPKFNNCQNSRLFFLMNSKISTKISQAFSFHARHLFLWSVSLSFCMISVYL